jgi:arylsulfatase
MKPRTFLGILFALIALHGELFSQSSNVFAQPPNIVFIIADDLGWGELGCYGQQKIRTPNLDQLAKEGMRFQQHYSGAPVCAPARCVLLTGQSTFHAQIRGNKDSGNGQLFPGQWPITADVVTIATVLKRAGYATGGFGKWGLGPTKSTGSPMNHGFDRFFGYNCQRNAHSYYPPFLDDDAGIRRINSNPVPGHKRRPEGEIRAEDYRTENYAPDLILAEAVKYIDANAKRPFFLYLPFVEPHVAMHPPQAWLNQYPDEWDMEHGAYRGQNGYLPHPRPRAGYAAMISDLDEHVGTILERLEHHGLTGNTMIVFTSDNGPTHGGNDPRWSVGGAACEFFESTGGLRGYKGSCYEGGIRVPCIVKWPGRIKSGSVSDVVTHFVDWFPTLTSIAGGKLPDIQKLDGVDLSDVLQGQADLKREQILIWEFPEYGGQLAIRDGNWKLIRQRLQTREPGPWELYDLEKDIGEKINLAAENPEIVQRLSSIHQSIRVPNPNYPFPFFDKR